MFAESHPTEGVASSFASRNLSASLDPKVVAD
jgi:hypothetical protein